MSNVMCIGALALVAGRVRSGTPDVFNIKAPGKALHHLADVSHIESPIIPARAAVANTSVKVAILLDLVTLGVGEHAKVRPM
jgi:hypothetical protein